MRKLATILLSATINFLLIGCSTTQHHGTNWTNGACPEPSKEQINSNGFLIIENGVTLKCQLRPYVSNMICQGITDHTNADGIICQNGNGEQAIFLFDEHGVLIQHKWL